MLCAVLATSTQAVCETLALGPEEPDLIQIDIKDGVINSNNSSSCFTYGGASGTPMKLVMMNSLGEPSSYRVKVKDGSTLLSSNYVDDLVMLQDVLPSGQANYSIMVDSVSSEHQPAKIQVSVARDPSGEEFFTVMVNPQASAPSSNPSPPASPPCEITNSCGGGGFFIPN